MFVTFTNEFDCADAMIKDGGELQVGIVFNYGHITIPRHLRNNYPEKIQVHMARLKAELASQIK